MKDNEIGNSESAGSPIILYYYFDLGDTDWFCKSLEQRFRASGHRRKITFVN